jgi:hypothetical protein
MFNQGQTTIMTINLININDMYLLQKETFYDPPHTVTFIVCVLQLAYELVGCVPH